MDDRHPHALSLAAAALVLGIAGDLLLRWAPWGANAPMWIALFVLLAAMAAARNGRKIAALPALCALVAAAGIAWRDSPVLRGLDIVLLLVLIPLLALRARGVRLARATVSELAIAAAAAATAVQTVAGFPQLIFADVAWSRLPKMPSMRAGTVLARGAILATPALILFGSLLVAADAHFARVLQDILLFHPRELLLHIIVSALLAAVCAGFLRSLVFSGAAFHPARPAFLRLPAAEATIALTLVNLLFAIFAGVQFRYFFGSAGTAPVAEYARRGFFELVGVVALVLPMLLVVDWLVDKKEGAGVFRSMAAMQVALVLVIALSAWYRMQLYRDAYGLTQLRLYTTAFMLWLAVLLVWLAATVLTGHRHLFAAGAFVSAMIAVVALHAINPDALIVRTNLARAESGRREFDQAYAVTLSDDAAPVIAAHRESFKPLLFERYAARPRPVGWRTWNLSRARSAELFAGYESKATPPIGRPGRVVGSTRESSSSRRLVISRNR